MKKNKIAAAYNNNMNFINKDCVIAIEMYKKMEKENGLKLFPINDYKKLGVAYHCQDVNGEISITFFDRTKTTSTMDVYAKAAAGEFNIVGEDCVYYPAQLIGTAIVPNWEFQSTHAAMIMGSMNFETFVARMKI